jgi:hypothetical protein
MTMPPNDEIVKIAWHEDQPGEFSVVFSDDRNDVMSGRRSEAQALARDLGLILAIENESSAEWIREP